MNVNEAIESVEKMELTENSLVLIKVNERMSYHEMENLVKGFKNLNRDNKIPLVILPKDDEMSLSTIDEMLEQLNTLKNELGERND